MHFPYGEPITLMGTPYIDNNIILKQIICKVSLSKENNMTFRTWQKQYVQGCQK